MRVAAKSSRWAPILFCLSKTISNPIAHTLPGTILCNALLVDTLYKLHATPYTETCKATKGSFSLHNVSICHLHRHCC
ncbi:hypothetical protein K431DRAFT_54681 [Polychaeton citri CBS 116435]|uniref:Uncharacterized protein n=1 Tax=Polychaeton citri CBS 116435 TaxID=1314669 RepID=A0A9P4QEP9_9PEZI|nr:hypothetical protein K431DRAFT_54681 [Polychaeton citri CBS 116435]